MVFLAAVPEAAAVAEGAAGAEGAGAARGAASKAARRGAGARKPRTSKPITNGMSPAAVQAELDARKEEAAAAKAHRDNGGTEDTGTSTTTPAPASASSPSALSLRGMDPRTTGSGFVFGVFTWVVFMQYVQGGMPQVRRWGAAKFLNKVGGTR